MKKLLATLIFGVSVSLSAQNVFLVDNTTTAPTGGHVYSNLQAAVDASTPGTIIHVKPSSLSYGTVTINATKDSITIYGIGINPDKEISLASTVTYMYVDGYNNKISGLYINNAATVGYNEVAGNISFENCVFGTAGYVYVGRYNASSNVLFRNCIFRQTLYTYATTSSNTVVNNSIFAWSSTSTTSGQIRSENGTLFSHCLFIASGSTKYAFDQLNNSTVSNSIFFGASPRAVNGYTNATYNNCYAEQSHDNTFPTDAGNSINGLIATISGTVFTDTTNIVLGNYWDINWDPSLDPASVELIGTGDDGTDIGLTGGTIPWSVSGAPLPYIKSLVVPSVIKQGDDLNVTIKANGN